MKGLSLLALILLLSINADGVTGAICTPTGGILVVSSGQSCDLTTSLTGLTEAQIYGTVYVFGTPGNVAPVLEAHNIYVYSTGTIVADGNGYDAMNGPGKGSTTGSGGSHGGRGGMKTGVYLKSDEAITYGSIEKPSYYGSGGGCSTGGKGGGVITLQADSSIQIDGLVSANGNNDGGSCGGGSGGSIYINTDYFKGSGMITARGGAGSGTGGGGGGGRISIVHRVSKTFTGNIFADGGDISGDIVLLPIASMNAYDYNTDTSYYGDMTKHATVSWRANTMSTVQWLEATLSPAKWITRIATRGHPNANYYVTKYKIQYYNDTSLLWVPLSFPSDGYSGNTDKSGVVTNNLFAPIYTTKIRFYPQTWYRGIGMAVSLYGYSNYDLASVPPTTCSSITTAGPGGPGTIFLAQSGFGVGTIVVDARGKDPKVKKTDLCDQFDPVASGGVAWINEDSYNLDEIVLTYGAHLVISNYTSVSQILTDATNRSVLHILPKATLELGTTLTVPCFVYPTGVLKPALGTTIYIEKWLYVLGNITFRNDESVIVNGNLTIAIQNFTTLELKVGTTGIMSVIPLANGTIFPLDTFKFSVYGIFKCNLINITNIQMFTVGTTGVVDMVPVTTDMYMGRVINIQGLVNFHHEISIIHPCEQFYITGSTSKLIWDNKANITLECLDVLIDGYFKPGTINFGTGVVSLRVGSFGDFEFAADGPILTNSFWASGTTKITNIAEFKSLNRSDFRIEVFVVNAGGYLYLNSNSTPKLLDHTQVLKVALNKLH